jgi:hypothetical protein
MKYIQHPDYVQYCNDMFVINALWMLAFMVLVVIPYFTR